MGAVSVVLAILFIVGIVVGLYFLYKKFTTSYFSESFMYNNDELACQNLDQFDKFKDKLKNINEDDDTNDYVKNTIAYLGMNVNLLYPKLKNGYVILWKCEKDSSFSKINKDLFNNKYNTFVNAQGIYNKSTNDFQILSLSQQGNLILSPANVNQEQELITKIKSVTI